MLIVSQVAVVVRVQRHLLAEGLHVSVKLEIRFACLALSPQLSRLILTVLGNLMNLEDAGVVIEDMPQKPT
jgi:hypothetical protein